MILVAAPANHTVQCCYTSTETVATIRDGHLDFSTDPELSDTTVLSLAEAATSIIFVATNTCLLRQNKLVTTKHTSRQFLLLRQNLCRNKHTFVATKDVFCRDKHVFAAYHFCRHKTFVATKMILVAAPANGVVQCCFTSTETVRTIRDGEPRTATSIFTQLLSSEILHFNVALRPQKI